MTGGDDLLDRVDLAEVVATFGRLLHAAGVPVTPERSERFAAALTRVRPARLDELYWAGRVTLATGRGDLDAYDRVFGQVFGGRADVADWRGQDAPLKLSSGARNISAATARDSADISEPASRLSREQRRPSAKAWKNARLPFNLAPQAMQ